MQVSQKVMQTALSAVRGKTIVPEFNEPGRDQSHCCAEAQQQRTWLGLVPCDAVM